MHEMGPRGLKHHIFDDKSYLKNARKLIVHAFLYVHARKHMIS